MSDEITNTDVLKLPEYHTSIVLDEQGVSEPMDMLAGYMDKDGVLQKTFTIRGINGLDEKEIKKPINLKQGKLEIVILSRCVMSIGTLKKQDMSKEAWEKIMRGLYRGDADFILSKLAELSIGGTRNVSQLCPECGTSITSEIETSDYKVIPFSGDTEIPFTLSVGYRDGQGHTHKDGYVRLATIEDAARANASYTDSSDVAMAIIARIARFSDDYPMTQTVMDNLVMRDRLDLINTTHKMLFGVDSTMEFVCPECGETFKAKVPLDFL